MANYLELDHVVDVARPALLDYIRRHLHSHIRILFVVDTEINLGPGAESFGVERVIRLLRETAVGCMRFHVDVALRSNSAFGVVGAPMGTNAKYLGFRFDSALTDGTKVIDHYDEVWCFGFKPDNLGGGDANITAPDALSATDAELAALTTWMNKRGGVFATGDHDYLGASMCHRIPRVGTMRAWTNAQGVPPIGGPMRIDTNRPVNAAELAGTEVIEFARQSDAVPQPIDWVPWMSYSDHRWHVRRRPHPVLCHPQLGPINVMPDHPHEGVVFDHVAQPSVGVAPITLTNAYNFGVAVTGAEYPTAGGVQPFPMVIAHGRTLADPPLMQEKGDSPAKRFAMISVYDGHRANVGRVATDSTWHHWMNINLTGLEAAGGSNWEKIARYYLNLAMWLAPPHVAKACFTAHVLESFYSYPGIEEFRPGAHWRDLGSAFKARLVALYGPCWVSSFVIDFVGDLDVKLRERLIGHYLALPTPRVPIPPRPNPCLTCPPPELFEEAVLGGVIRATAETLQQGGGGIEASVKRLLDLSPEHLNKRVLAGAGAGLADLQSSFSSSLAHSDKMFAVDAAAHSR